MDKYKLVQIINKDLEEIKTLSDEIEANEEVSSLIIDLALSRARLLCQELELLRSYSAPDDSLKEDAGIANPEEDEDEEPELSFTEPELEILHFEGQDFPEKEEIAEDEEERIVYDSEDEEPEEEEGDDIDEDEELKEDDLTEDDDSEDEPIEEEDSEDEDLEEDDSIGIEEHELKTEEVSKIEDEEPAKSMQQSVRQMKIDELDEVDDAIEFTPVSKPENRPVMHEIPKPEEHIHEAPVEEEEEEEVPDENDDQEIPTSETIQKERTLNETIGENKAETNLSNSPITSLRAAIGLNDRFLFIKEIFNNNSEKYNTIIDQLDKMETIQQAVDYLKVNLSLQKNETSMKFVDLLKRRFTK